MKAIIMAGGEGTRLRPVSVLRPKPMVDLMNKPVAEHIVNLLKKYGVTDICITLGYLPQVVKDYFGDGSDFGVKIQYSIEEEPLGTAGGVRACKDFVGKDDFIVISGDAVCSFDLGKCFEFHSEKRSPATIVLYRSQEPLEYGLVLTDETSRVTQFVEKPSWDMVLTDAVNTGIYILSPEILNHIPEGEKFDFGKDLFPELVRKNVPIYAVTAEGYWCDIGSGKAYLECVFDVLEGRVGIDLGKMISKGVWANSRLPEKIMLYPPCYIGSDVTIEDNANLGPFAVIGNGSHIAEGSKIENSYIIGAEVGKRSEVSGSIICRKARIGSDCIVSEACIIGEAVAIGHGSYIADNVRIWPGKAIESGSRVMSSVIHESHPSSVLLFHGRLSGEVGTGLSFESLINVGSALAGFKKVVVQNSGSPAAAAAASAVKCGICAGGGDAWEGENSFESATAFCARHYETGASVFVRQSGPSLSISFFDNSGRPFERTGERKIEAALSGETVRAPYNRIGRIGFLPDTLETYALSAVKQAFYRDKAPCRIPVFVFGDSTAALTLKRTLSVLGCPTARRKEDGVCFQISDDGFTLIAEQGGMEISNPQLLVMLALLEFEIGTGRVAVPPSAPAVIEMLGQSLGCKVYKYGRDNEADSLLRDQAFMYDGVFAAARLITGLSVRGETLSHLANRIPEFYIAQKTVLLKYGVGAVMRDLIAAQSEVSAELSGGLSILTDRGFVHISPRKNGLRIATECSKLEIAEELCTRYEDIIKKLEKKQKK